ncbi:MAG TPA: class I SAM-dependent methyltransferase [Candidatus Edwardsbacteria bacterium]|nr:class I SAM-dependent methyltransferase [Candidatus Edwardsbacteria bacterium]
MPQRASANAPVRPERYTEEYFRTCCGGQAGSDYQRFIASGGSAIPDRLEIPIRLAGDLTGQCVLDVGTGRGEVAAVARARGAWSAGCDYAGASLAIARETLRAVSGSSGALSRNDVKRLPFRTGSFDAVFLLDVAEHLHPWELRQCLAEASRVLRPGGRLIIHTNPNKWYRVGLNLLRYRQALRDGVFPRPLWRRFEEDEMTRAVHVNHQSVWSLWNGLRLAGLRPRVWAQPLDQASLDEPMTPLHFVRRRLLSWWVYLELFAVGTKPGKRP